jgi:hypothetical protein
MAALNWALAALGLWGSSPTAKLYATVASRDLEIADLKQERTVIEQQLDRAVRQRDDYRDVIGNCQRELNRVQI